MTGEKPKETFFEKESGVGDRSTGWEWRMWQ